MKILAGQISSPKAIVICRFIKKLYPGVLLLTYDYKPFTKRIRTKYSDRHFVIPRSGKIDALSRIIKSEDVDIFIPVMSGEIEEFLSEREKFGKSLNYMSSIDSYRVLHYKNNLIELALSMGLKAPAKYKTVSEAKLPFIIKPVNSSSAKGVKYILNKKDYNKLKGEYPEGEYIIQEYVEGYGAGYSAFCKDGNILTGYGHKRLAEYPVKGGSSVYRTAFDFKEIKEISSKLIKAVNWSGFCMIEFKIDRNYEAFLIEVNPRVWGSIYQGLAEGINYFEYLLGKPAGALPHYIERNTYISPLIYLSLFKYLIKGNIKPLGKFLTDLNKRADVSLFDDPSGYISVIAKKFFRKGSK